jgi:hypothetical protein
MPLAARAFSLPHDYSFTRYAQAIVQKALWYQDMQNERPSNSALSNHRAGDEGSSELHMQIAQ